MFANIGKKIKALAQVICWAGIIISVIVAMAMFIMADDMYYIEGLCYLLGGVILIIGPLLSWLGSFLLYGFGEIIYKLTEIERNTRGGESQPKAPTKVNYKAPTKNNYDRLKLIEDLRSEDLISEEEYQAKKADILYGN